MMCGVKRAAVIGGGISGMMSAYVMAKEGIEVVLYEKEACLGGHANTVTVNGTQLDIGFQVFNRVTYPNMMELYESLGVDMEPSDMSFSVSLADGQGCEWGTRSFSSLFAQKKNIFNPKELNNNEDIDRNETLGHFVRSRGYSELFEKAFLIPTCASIWSCPKEIMDLSAYSVLSFLRNHHALQVSHYIRISIIRWHILIFVAHLLNIDKEGLPFFSTLNPPYEPENTVLKWSTSHPIPSVGATKASAELNCIQGKRRIWFCGAFQGYGFHEDGLKAGALAANSLLRKDFTLQQNPKYMTTSWSEAGARLLVTRLLEEGGTIFTFEGSDKSCTLKVSLRIHTPQFYWKIAKESDLGLADAYINGDFTFVDKKKGLLNLFMSNELFSLFLDESMAYSCAVFKTTDEDLKNAQLRKIDMLIEKARINKEHHVLEIGCGWGSLAIEIVKRTGCKYTGITLSEKQLQYAELKVKEAGLQDQIKFLLCDYRQLPEAVGHEYMEEFFRCCETALADNGLFVLQFISIADEKYDEYRLSQGFIKEYIFPGGCLPSLSRVTSAMATASRLSVSHLEDIGIHYYQTLRCWRENLLINQNKILALGFDDKFMRTWEYYFDYCAAGFKLRVLGTYQIVFSRPGDVAAFGCDPLTSAPF
ncbi:cyclopropane-fatty-acyl-phospholipid synthase [Striga asiatica]|uniref:Cyclopropane-fatty-acyl-phospholipid synthase n=1 Tax=Striga asiatica TaxID=4170 RepID=A0A5A7R4K6_STRAF|nr:cyclopropane-fatty-acyl-phospholipid synthase [Striga asiatica]